MRGTTDEYGRPGWVDRSIASVGASIARSFVVFQLAETLDAGKKARAERCFFNGKAGKEKFEALPPGESEDPTTRQFYVWDATGQMVGVKGAIGIALRLWGRYWILTPPVGIPRFRLKAKLTVGGSADAVELTWDKDQAKLVEGTTTFKVYDAIGTFKGDSGSNGYYVFMGDAQRREIIQLTCN